MIAMQDAGRLDACRRILARALDRAARVGRRRNRWPGPGRGGPAL